MTEPTPSGPTLDDLAAAGVDFDLLSDEQRAVLGSLTSEELSLLIDIKVRLDEAAPEVQAHADVAGGALF
ncbi:aroma-sacti cluster domain-containing protein [Streptomyces sp. NBRC 109706]|uniref:aroma-sacti cluster domain-containing protein n=1 Tax=Streptomyces sp. NBRC 109706 TaxID=1550035 RepID=UPI000780F8C7|nr:aroma-sacti cluster domain-containing protein [Streptomyces sp. NBRC 109706]